VAISRRLCRMTLTSSTQAPATRRGEYWNLGVYTFQKQREPSRGRRLMIQINPICVDEQLVSRSS
jgi:hypothetical protein